MPSHSNGETSAARYAAWLAQKMREEGLSVHGLAKRWNQADPETARRSLRRYLNGGRLPNAQTRDALARLIGCYPETGPESSDSKEEDLHAERVVPAARQGAGHAGRAGG